MNELKHARITTRIPRPDDPDTVDIKHESYVEELNTMEQQIEQSIMTTKASLASDVLGCLREINKGEALSLTIKVELDKFTAEPKRIIKTWTVEKQYYGKR